MTRFSSVTVGRTAFSVVLAGALLVPAACSRKEPSAQTVAVVNGDEITVGDLNLELSSIPPEERERARPKLVEALVQRKLLAQDAVKKGIDKKPAFILQERRAHDLLLAQQAIEASITTSRERASYADVSDYVKTHPNIGEQHKVLSVSQLQFATPDSPSKIDALKPAKSLDELAAILKSQGIQPKSAQAQLDTAMLSDDVLGKIASLQPGEPIISINGKQSIASAIIEVRAQPLDASHAETIARRQIESMRLKERVDGYSRALLKDAKITYGPTFAPKK